MQQRLDQIEDEFETVKQLLMSAARYAESANERIDSVAEKLDQLTEKQDRTQQQLDTLSGRFDQLTSKVDQLTDRVDQLTTAQTRTQQQLDQLTTEVSELRFTMEAAFVQAEQDRNQAAIDRAEFRTTVTQLLQVLTQRFNGNGQNNQA